MSLETRFTTKGNTEFDRIFLYTILRIIRDNQEFLYKNRDVAAKIGYIFEKIHHIGRASGLGCDDNPKYDLCDHIEWISEDIENAIYDAWGMHITMSVAETVYDLELFKKLIFEGKELTDFQKKFRQINKTFDEWVEVLTSEEYEYTMDNRKAVADHLLCVVGSGFELSKEGYIYQTACGADQDVGSYGEWENAKLEGDILKDVESMFNNPLLEKAFKKAFDNTEKSRKEEEKREARWNDPEFQAFLEEEKKREKGKYKPYYGISDNYSYISNILKDGKAADPSYFYASLEICKDILDNRDKESKENIDFAEKMIKKYESKYVIN